MVCGPARYTGGAVARAWPGNGCGRYTFGTAGAPGACAVDAIFGCAILDGSGRYTGGIAACARPGNGCGR